MAKSSKLLIYKGISRDFEKFSNYISEQKNLINRGFSEIPFSKRNKNEYYEINYSTLVNFLIEYVAMASPFSSTQRHVPSSLILPINIALSLL